MERGEFTVGSFGEEKGEEKSEDFTTEGTESTEKREETQDPPSQNEDGAPAKRRGWTVLWDRLLTGCCGRKSVVSGGGEA